MRIDGDVAIGQRAHLGAFEAYSAAILTRVKLASLHQPQQRYAMAMEQRGCFVHRHDGWIGRGFWRRRFARRLGRRSDRQMRFHRSARCFTTAWIRIQVSLSRRCALALQLAHTATRIVRSLTPADSIAETLVSAGFKPQQSHTPTIAAINVPYRSDAFSDGYKTRGKRILTSAMERFAAL